MQEDLDLFWRFFLSDRIDWLDRPKFVSRDLGILVPLWESGSEAVILGEPGA